MFILTKDFSWDFSSDDFDLEEYTAAWAKYRAYVASLQGRIPPAAFAYATAEWHGRGGDPRWPHDGRLVELLTRAAPDQPWSSKLWDTIERRDRELDRRSPHPRSRSIEPYEVRYEAWLARLMAAHAEWEQPPGSGEPATLELLLHVRTWGDLYLDLHYLGVHRYVLAVAVGDWRYDDVHLAANGHIVHEIELISGTYWRIECEDIQATHRPIVP